ncbi:MAG: hypothetical protein EBU90_21570 [Proteobacteria bacterium]|nr:hypothetical protein [Pseudomonadota bacterium]
MRKVYALDKSKVYKIAKIKEGIQHNISEFDVYSATKSFLLPEFFDEYNNYSIICVERADTINEQDFFNLTGLIFEEFSNYCNALQQVLIRSYKDPEVNKNTTLEFNKLKHSTLIQNFEKNNGSKKFVKEIKNIFKMYGQNLRDFKRISSYGKNIDNKIKIIDYGIYKRPFSKY